MPSVLPTTQWVNADRPVLGDFGYGYLVQDAVTGDMSITRDVSVATHMFARDPETGNVGIIPYVPARSMVVVLQNKNVSLARVPDMILITAAPALIDFAAIEQGADPAPQLVDITSASAVADLAASIAYGDGEPAGWLTAVLNQTSTPAVLTLTAVTGVLPAGTLNATVTISGALAKAEAIPVTFELTPMRLLVWNAGDPLVDAVHTRSTVAGYVAQISDVLTNWTAGDSLAGSTHTRSTIATYHEDV